MLNLRFTLDVNDMIDFRHFDVSILRCLRIHESFFLL